MRVSFSFTCGRPVVLCIAPISSRWMRNAILATRGSVPSARDHSSTLAAPYIAPTSASVSSTSRFEKPTPSASRCASRSTAVDRTRASNCEPLKKEAAWSVSASKAAVAWLQIPHGSDVARLGLRPAACAGASETHAYFEVVHARKTKSSQC